MRFPLLLLLVWFFTAIGLTQIKPDQGRTPQSVTYSPVEVLALSGGR